MINIYSRQSKAKRDKIRKSLQDVIALRKMQIAIIEKDVIEPLKTDIAMANDVLKSKVAIEQYLDYSNKITDHVNNLFAQIITDEAVKGGRNA